MGFADLMAADEKRTDQPNLIGTETPTPYELHLLVDVALGTVERRRKRRQTMMTVAGESYPIDFIEAVAKKYAGTQPAEPE